MRKPKEPSEYVEARLRAVVRENRDVFTPYAMWLEVMRAARARKDFPADLTIRLLGKSGHIERRGGRPYPPPVAELVREVELTAVAELARRNGLSW